MNNAKVTQILFMGAFFLGLLLSTNSVLAEENLELQRSSIVVVSQPEFKLYTKQQFSWADNYADISGELKKSTFSVQQLIDQAIIKALTSRGMSLKANPENSLLIQYHVSLESEMDDTALAINYGLAPGLRANSDATRKHQRGTLVVDFIDPKLKKVVWRGAIGVFTGIVDTDQARQQRVNKLLDELFISIAAAN